MPTENALIGRKGAEPGEICVGHYVHFLSLPDGMPDCLEILDCSQVISGGGGEGLSQCAYTNAYMGTWRLMPHFSPFSPAAVHRLTRLEAECLQNLPSQTANVALSRSARFSIVQTLFDPLQIANCGPVFLSVVCPGHMGIAKFAINVPDKAIASIDVIPGVGIWSLRFCSVGEVTSRHSHYKKWPIHLDQPW